MATLSWRGGEGPRRGVALVVHGLNQRPACMAPVIDLLAGHGIGCVGLSLRGHGDNYTPEPGLEGSNSPAAARLAALQKVHAALWLGEAAAAYALARTVSKRAGLPLYLAAYSLGGLVVCDLLAREATLRFERMLLLAPALAIRPWTRLLRRLAWRPATVIPSLAPPVYRANMRGTPIAAYNAAFTMADHLVVHAGAWLDVPTLVLVDPADELVPVAGLARLIAAKRWREWRVVPVQKTPPAQGQYHHLIVGPEAVGETTWVRMAGMMAEHLCDKDEG